MRKSEQDHNFGINSNVSFRYFYHVYAMRSDMFIINGADFLTFVLNIKMALLKINTTFSVRGFTHFLTYFRKIRNI